MLERYHVPATFFQIGEWISVYGQHDRLEQRNAGDGDMIGDHTWTHPNYTGTGPYERVQVVRAADAIRAATGFYPCLFRAPYGNTSPAQLAQIRSLGMTTIQWDIDPRDWALPGVAAIEDDVLTNARNGGIVEMHDGGGPPGDDRRAADDHHHAAKARLSVRDDHADAGIPLDLQVERRRGTITRLHLRRWPCRRNVPETGHPATTASATGGSRPGRLLCDIDASALPAQRERFATNPVVIPRPGGRVVMTEGVAPPWQAKPAESGRDGP